MIMRASQYGISSKLLALLGGMGAGSSSQKLHNKDLLDASEGKIFSDKKEAKDWD